MELLRNVLFCLMIFGQEYAQCQVDISWERSYGGSGADGTRKAIKLMDGGYYVLGISVSSDNDVSLNLGGRDMWLIKIDSSGNLISETSFGGSQDDDNVDIIYTSDDGFVFCGSSRSKDGHVPKNNGENDVWILKLDHLGNILWSKTFGGSGNDFGRRILEIENGDFLVLLSSDSRNGDFKHNYGERDVIIMRIDRLGNLIWQKNYGGSGYDFPENIIELTNGDFLISASSNSNDLDVGTSGTSTDFWLFKIDEDGVILSSAVFGGSRAELWPVVFETEDYHYLISGPTTSNDGNMSQNYGSYDAWVAKIDSNLNFVWEKSIGGSDFDRIVSIEETNVGTIILGGFSRSDDFDLDNNYGERDAWLVEMNQSGGVLQEQNFGGSEDDVIDDLLLLSDGTIVLFGGSKSMDADVQNNYGSFDLWVLELDNIQNSTYSRLREDCRFVSSPSSSTVILPLNYMNVEKTVYIHNQRWQLISAIRTRNNYLKISHLPPSVYNLTIVQDDKACLGQFIKLE